MSARQMGRNSVYGVYVVSFIALLTLCRCWSRAAGSRLVRLVHAHFQPLLAADEDGPGLGPLVGADDPLLLHLVHDAGGPGIAQLAPALQQAGEIGRATRRA